VLLAFGSLNGAPSGIALWVLGAIALGASAWALWLLRQVRRSEKGQRTSEAARDVAEGALRDSHQFLEALIENLPAMLFVKDAERLSFQRFNAAGERLLGWPREALLGKTDFDFFPEAEARFFQEKDRETLRAGKLVDIPEEPIQTRNGLRWLHTQKVPVQTPNGEPKYLLGISLDITERKRVQDALRRTTEELRAVNAELEAFAYSVSHDLRAPLRAIDGFSQALTEDCGEQLDDTGKEHLRRVRASAQKMGVLIDDLLRLSRVTRSELHLSQVSLSALCEEIVAELRRRDPHREVEVRIAPGLVAQADAHLVRVLLTNLLENAWKFTAKTPGACIEVGESSSDGQRTFFVKDTGSGFDAQYVGKLFRPFQRLHTPTEFEGTGIGLATVQRVASRHGGRVWAEGAVGKGATVFFTLDGAVAAEAPAVAR
jgi:PAS domain S-box-containing protein